MSGRNRNSRDDKHPRSKINTETESSETREGKTCNVRSLAAPAIVTFTEDPVLSQQTVKSSSIRNERKTSKKPLQMR